MGKIVNKWSPKSSIYLFINQLSSLVDTNLYQIVKENQQPLQRFNDKPQWGNTSSTFESALASCAHVLLRFQEMFVFLVF